LYILAETHGYVTLTWTDGCVAIEPLAWIRGYVAVILLIGIPGYVIIKTIAWTHGYVAVVLLAWTHGYEDNVKYNLDTLICRCRTFSQDKWI
jgi:hypothetical protein